MKLGTLRYHPGRGFAVLADTGETIRNGKAQGQPLHIWVPCGPVSDEYFRVLFADAINAGGNTMTYWSPKTPARRG